MLNGTGEALRSGSSDKQLVASEDKQLDVRDAPVVCS
uniref:Uncharacterized protein n=1 Tax=Arundo donax TaxID=35708 RepID=A0A0A9AZV5_ARUDO